MRRYILSSNPEAGGICSRMYRVGTLRIYSFLLGRIGRFIAVQLRVACNTNQVAE
jgi:hypothetical protein